MTFQKGNVPWNKDTKGLQVAWNKGKKGLQVAWNKDKKGVQISWNKNLTKETDKRVAKSAQKLKGRIFSQKHRKNLSLSTKRRPDLIKLGRKVSQSNRGKPRKPFSIEHRKKLGKAQKLNWKNDEYIRKQMKAKRLKPNKTELFLNGLIQITVPNVFNFTGDGSLLIGRRCPDWTHNNGVKKLIELFGDYHHYYKPKKYEDPIWSHSKAEKERIKYFAKYGYRTLIIWEHELKNTELVIQKIKEFEEKGRS